MTYAEIAGIASTSDASEARPADTTAISKHRAKLLDLLIRTCLDAALMVAKGVARSHRSRINGYRDRASAVHCPGSNSSNFQLSLDLTHHNLFTHVASLLCTHSTGIYRMKRTPTMTNSHHHAIISCQLNASITSPPHTSRLHSVQWFIHKSALTSPIDSIDHHVTL